MNHPRPQDPIPVSQGLPSYPTPHQMGGGPYPPFPHPGFPQYRPYAGWMQRADALTAKLVRSKSLTCVD